MDLNGMVIVKKIMLGISLYFLVQGLDLLIGRRGVLLILDML